MTEERMERWLQSRGESSHAVLEPVAHLGPTSSDSLHPKRGGQLQGQLGFTSSIRHRGLLTEDFSKGHLCLKTLVVIQNLHNSLFQEDVPVKPPLLLLTCLLL